MNECKIKMHTDEVKAQLDFTNGHIDVKNTHVRNRLSPSVYIDGKPIEIRHVGFRNDSECSFTTDKDTVEITMTKHYMMEGKHWFLMNLLFYFISLFGIFDAGDGRKFFSYTYTALLHLNGSNNIEVYINKFVNGQRALEVQGDCVIEEKENAFIIREDLRKRRKKLNWVKALLWIAVIAVIVGIIIFNTI